MCDTLFKKIGNVSVFLKNSDRAVNEPNLLVFSPSRKATNELKTTYITIPDTDSFATLLYKPSWLWGAEMGINEKGVAIGNEAVFTKKTGIDKKKESLIGMDFLRLGLERGDCAKNAVFVILELLKEFGQGGNCGFDHPFYYDNSFLIADKKEAFILETAGKNFALKKIEGQGNISNRLSVSTDYFESSIKGDFKKAFFEPVYSFFSGSKIRKEQGNCSLNRIDSLENNGFTKSAISALRSHKEGAEGALFSKGSVKSVCMHAGILGDHTTGSMAVFFIKDRIFIWASGSSTPCLSVFKPINFDLSGEKIFAPAFLNEQDSFNFWLKRERLNRAIYSNLVDVFDYKAKKESLENEFFSEFEQIVNEENLDIFNEKYIAFCLKCSQREEEFINSYGEIIKKVASNPSILTKYWAKKSENLGKNAFESELSNRIKRG